MLKLAIKSLANRKTSALLTVIAIAVSVALLLAVERVKEQVQANFANTVSGTDLIIGPRSGDVQLLLASVFHIGALNNSMSWQSYERLSQNRQVEWSVPISLGDSVSGMPVVATTAGYFQHFKYANQQPLKLQHGEWFNHSEQAVLGADAAEKLAFNVGDQLIIAHGTGGISFSQHSGHPIDVVGVLKRTGTPVDQSVYVDLETLEDIHSGTPDANADDKSHHSHDEHADHHHPTNAISAALIGLKSRQMALFMQRDINTADGEPLTALMPGQTLQQLWKTLRVFQQALNGISAIVVIIGLLGMLTILLASLRERSREMAVLRAVGAGPGTLFTLLVTEAVLLTIIATASGLALLYILQISLAGVIQQQTGLLFALQWPTAAEWWRMLFVVVAGFLMSLVPAWRAYRQSLADGLTVKV
jgi:putative ABC transport system permease protein